MTYLRYYQGHRGRYGHEYFEFTVRDNGEVRYVNSSGYGADSSRKAGAIKREVYVSDEVLDEVARQVNESMILGEKRVAEWPEADETGKQILTFKLASGEQGYFTTTKLGSLSQVERTKDPEGLKKFFYLVQDLKSLVLSLINLNFKVKPI